jgi:hypothetical protein
MADRLMAIGGLILRYGLVVLLLWYGAFKFTEDIFLLGAAVWTAGDALKARKAAW